MRQLLLCHRDAVIVESAVSRKRSITSRASTPASSLV